MQLLDKTKFGQNQRSRYRSKLPLLTLMLATAFKAAAAGEESITLALPAQSLVATLDSIAKSSHTKLIYADSVVQGLQADALQGTLTVRQALEKALSKSGLHVDSVGESLVIVKANDDSSLSVVKVTAKSEIFDRNDPFDRHYNTPSTSTATKTATPLMETPMSVQIVPKAVMDDQQVLSIEDALKNVTGVQAFQGYYVNPMIRGFSGDSSTFRDGLRQDTVSFIDPAGLASVEVVKGATGLFGRLPVGGMVNNVTKRPLDYAYYAVQQQFGSFDLYRTTFDASGPLLKDKTLLYRMNIAYKDNNSFRDYNYNNHVFLMPSVTWRPNDKFDLNVNGEYQHDETMTDNGLIALGNRPINLPISTCMTDCQALQNYPIKQDRKVAAYDWNYKFNNDWKITNRFAYNETEFYQPSFNPLTLIHNNTLTQGLSLATQHRTEYNTNLDITGKFTTGILHHEVLVGSDYFYFYQFVPPYHAGASSLLPNINIYNPYEYPIDVSKATINSSYQSVSEWNGVYLQDQVTLWDKLHLMAGMRWDTARYGAANGSGKAINQFGIPISTANMVNPRFGITYQPVEWASIYGNYIQSMGVATAVAANGQSFGPQLGSQYEIGVKNEFFDKRLMTTLAYFDIAKTNIPIADVAHPGYSIAIGEQHNKGMEFTIQGEVTKNISLIAGYSYLDAVISRASDGTQGNTFPNVAHNSGNFWGTYKFDENDYLSGINLGTGVYIQGLRQGDTKNSFQLPGYARWDASISKSFNQFGSKITTQLNVYNILNQVYYTTSNSNVSINPGAPLTLMGSLKFEF